MPEVDEAVIRRWGDGLGKTRKHEIGFVSYERRMTGCAMDGEIMRFGPEGPEVAWDLHRGKQVSVEQYVIDKAALATDAEVHEFLRWIAQEDRADSLPPSVSRMVQTGATYETGDADTGIEFIEMIRERQALCTCRFQPIVYCPNYMDGDEELLAYEEHE